MLLLLVDIIFSIDYEYASMNFLPYDIGNHFCEYAGKQAFSWMLLLWKLMINFLYMFYPALGYIIRGGGGGGYER